MALRPLSRKDSIMSIEIDKDKFRDAIKGEFSSWWKANKIFEYGDAVLDTLQEWLDSEEWKDNPDIDSLREVRILMRLYVVSKLKQDKSSSWFVPSHRWIQIARKVSVWIVMKVALEYWDEMAAEKGLTPKD